MCRCPVRTDRFRHKFETETSKIRMRLQIACSCQTSFRFFIAFLICWIEPNRKFTLFNQTERTKQKKRHIHKLLKIRQSNNTKGKKKYQCCLPVSSSTTG